MAKKKSEQVQLAELAARQDNIKLAVNTTTKLLTENKLLAGLAGYAGLTMASRLRDSKGDPYLAPVNAALLKGLSIGYIFGGWPGLAVGTAYAAGENIANQGGIIDSIPESLVTTGETMIQSNPVARFVTTVWTQLAGIFNR